MARRTRRPKSQPLTLTMLEDRCNPGGGTFVNGQFNFTVSMRFQATDAEIAETRRAIQIASDVLADATDGQHRFGTVTIVNNSGASNEADLWISKVRTTKDGWPSAVTGFGIRGLHVNMYFYTEDIDYRGQLYGGNGEGAGYSIAHEWGHFAYGIDDEYVPDGTNGNAPPKDESLTLDYSLMDNYFNRGGRNDPNPATRKMTLNEFSTKFNHDDNRDTNQSINNKRSDWEQIAISRFPATPPTWLPESKAPVSQPVNFVTNAVGTPYTMMVLDRSGQTLFNNRFNVIKSGARIFVNSSQDGDRTGVVTYATGAQLDRPLTALNNASDRQTMSQAIGNIQGTNIIQSDIHGGLSLALNQFNTATPNSANKVIILVAGGIEDLTQNPLTLIPTFQQSNVSVIVVHVNPTSTPAEVNLFRLLAESTGGKYFFTDGSVANSRNLVTGMLAERQGTGLFMQAPPETIGSGETRQESAEVPPGSGPVIFAVGVMDPVDQVTVRLISPSGQTITAGGPGIEAINDDVMVGYRIEAPEPGSWQVIAEAGTIAGGDILFLGLRPNDPIQVTVSAGSETGFSEQVFPKPVHVRVVPTFQGDRVVGASVQGFATTPDGTMIPMLFFDDGLMAHGDHEANDGVYTALFNTYTPGGNGTYDFTALVNAFGAQTYGGEVFPGTGSEPPEPRPVEPFSRFSSSSITVTGVPDVVIPGELGLAIAETVPGTITVSVMNHASTPATGVIAQVFLGRAIRIVQGQPSQGSFLNSNGDVVWSVGTLAPGDTAQLTMSLGSIRTDLFRIIGTVRSETQTDSLLLNNEFLLPVALTFQEGVVLGSDSGASFLAQYNPVVGPEFLPSPFGPEFLGGLRTSGADFNGDGRIDPVIGTGPGIPTRVLILDGVSGQALFDVAPFESTFQGGVFVSSGDLNGDHIPELLISPDEGGGPRVQVYNGADFVKKADFFGIGDPDFRGGARANVGDLNGDGLGDLVVSAGFGGGPRIAAFDGALLQFNGGPKLFGDFFAFEPELRNGAYVAAGDLNGDGFAELIAGAGPGGGPRVLALDGEALTQNNGQLTATANFFGGNVDGRGGIRVAVKDLDGDNKADLVVGAGTGAGSRVTAYLGKNITANGTPPAELDFDAFAGFTGGVFVG